MNVVVTDYATALTWETNSINGKKFNMTGFDDLIWGGNSKDYHVGYHGRGNRARFYINWVTGEGKFWTKEEELTEEDSHDDHDQDDHEHDIKDDSGTDHLSGYSAILASALSTLFWIF